MEEEQIHLDAFETYFAARQAGQSKTDAINAVRLQCDCGERRVWDWKKEFKWDEKEAIRSADINKEVQKQTDASIVDNKVKYLNYIHNAFENYTKGVNAGERDPIPINNMYELTTGIKTALALQGEPDTIQNINQEKSVVKTVEQLYEEMKRDEEDEN